MHRFIVRSKDAPVRVFQSEKKTPARKRTRAYEAEIDAGRGVAHETVADAIRFYEDSDDYALDELRRFIDRQPPHVSGKLFASRRGSPAAPRKQWDAAREAAGVLDTG